jgi:hypothetical protein
MDAIRLFLRSNSFRSSNGETDQKNNSTPNLTIENEDNQSSSSEKIKSYFLTHPSSTTVLPKLPKLHLELETCSGSSISEKPTDTNIAASAFESISNARSFTNHSYPTYRRSSLVENNELTRSWIVGQNIHHMLPPIRRIKSYRYPTRIRKHSLKIKHSNGTLTRRYSQVNKMVKKKTLFSITNIIIAMNTSSYIY